MPHAKRLKPQKARVGLLSFLSFLVCLIIIMYSPFTQAAFYQVGVGGTEGNIEQVPELFMFCNSLAVSENCEQYNQAHLERLAVEWFGQVEDTCEPPCQTAPTAPPDGPLQANFQMYAFVVNLKENKINKYLIEQYPLFNTSHYLVTKQETSVEEDLILSEAQALENIYETHRQAFHFTQDAQTGVFKNDQGQGFSEFGSIYAPPHGQLDNQIVNTLGNCKTAADWGSPRVDIPYLGTCSSFLNRQINQMAYEAYHEKTFGTILYQAITEWVGSFTIKGVMVVAPKYHEFPLTFDFKDGSRLVFNVKIVQDMAALVVNEELSLMANGQSFSEFEKHIRLTGSAEGLSYQEINGLFVNFSCRDQLQNADTQQRFRVEYLEFDSMGRPTRVKIILVEQIDLMESVLLCNSNF